MKKWYRIAAVVVVMVAVIAMVIISGVRRSGESEYTRNTITMGTAASFTVYGSHGSENIDGMLKLIAWTRMCCHGAQRTLRYTG